MAGYLVANYTITKPDAFKAYLRAVGKVLHAAGAEVLVADYSSEDLEGGAGDVTIVAKFESKTAARDWYNSPAYQDIVHHRTDNSEGVRVITDAFKLP